MQSYDTVHTSYNGLAILQCVPTPPVPLAPWYQRNSWIFIIVAVIAAAILVAMAWYVDDEIPPAVKGFQMAGSPWGGQLHQMDGCDSSSLLSLF